MRHELRLSKIAQLDSLDEECTKLLGQANLTLEGFTRENILLIGKCGKAKKLSLIAERRNSAEC